MSSFSLEQELKNRIPSFQRENEDLDEFLEAVGKYLDHIKEQIDNLKYRSDYESGSIAQIVSSLEQDDINFTFTSDDDAVARMVVRDIADIVRVKGTKKTIEWLFKAIDLNVNIEYAWILNPDTFEIPAQRDIVPSTFIYGRSYVYDDGVYFNGEGSDGTVYSKIPIVGERYPKGVDSSTTNVLKTPYIYLNVPLGEFNRFLDEQNLQSPKDFETIILENFNEIRPINVVLVIVIIPEGFSDIIPFGVFDRNIDIDSQYLVDSDDPRWLAGVTWDPNVYGEYFTTANDPIEGADSHTYVPSREEYVAVPHNILTRRFTSETPLNEWFQVRDHALVTFNVKTVSGTYELRHSDSPRTVVYDGSGVWTPFTAINPSNDRYMSNVHKFGFTPIGTIPYSSGTFGSGGVPYNSQITETDTEWYKTTTFEDMFVGKRAIQIKKSSDWRGSIDMDVEFFSMMHRVLFSYQMRTQFTRTSSGTQINTNHLLENITDNTPRALYRNDGIRQGYLFEGGSYQLLEKTQQLQDTSKWVRTRTTVSNTTVPFYNTVYQRVQRNLTTGVNDNLARITQTVTGMKTGTRYALSVFVHRSTTSGSAVNRSILLEQGTRSEVVTFRPTSKSFTSTAIGASFSNKKYVYQQIDENQYRITVTFDSNSTNDLNVGLLADYDNSNLNRFSSFSGVQLEEKVVTSYIPRDTASVLRASESASISSLPLALSNGGTIVIDCTTVNHKTGTIIEASSVSGSIRVRIQDQLLYINSQPVHTITYKENLFQNGIYIAFKPIGTDLQYWIQNDNGERNVGTIQNAGLQGVIGLKIGTDNQNSDPFYGIIRNVYVSTDDFNTSINRVYKSILLQYRSIRN